MGEERDKAGESKLREQIALSKVPEGRVVLVESKWVRVDVGEVSSSGTGKYVYDHSILENPPSDKVLLVRKGDLFQVYDGRSHEDAPLLRIVHKFSKT